MLTLVTVIYGDNRDYQIELYGSVLSILKLRRSSDTRIVIYTDRPLKNFPLPVTQTIITPDEWENWTHGSTITHLVKLHLVRKILEESCHPVIYFDTDTLFLTPPETLADRLSPQQSMMHAAEGPILEHEIWSNIVDWLKDGRDVAGANLSSQSVMHNSGIVGVVPEQAPALCRSINIANTLFDIDPVFNLDQFSTGVALSTDSKIVTCENDVLHYWGWERGFIRNSIAQFWEQNAHTPLDKLCSLFDPVKLSNVPRIFWQDKLLSRLTAFFYGLDPNARFALLALDSALRVGAADPINANLWFGVHIQMLRDNSEHKRLKRQLSRKYDECSSWLDKENCDAISGIQAQLTKATDKRTHV